MGAKVTSRMSGDEMVVTVKGAGSAGEARKLAMRAAGTVAVGTATPEGDTHVIRVSAKALAARKVVGSLPPARAMRDTAPDLAAVLASLDPSVAKVIQAALAGATPAKAPAKAPREVPAFIVAKAKARAAAKCQTCLDFGRVRTTPDAKGRLHFRTANGAATSPTGVACTACKRGRKSA